jgi:competence protein ComEC
VVGAILILAVCFWQGYSRASVVELRFLAVGQGDAILYRGDGVCFLVDAGPRNGNFDSGAGIVVPRLRKLGCHRLDMVFLTHPDGDHIGGFPAVMRAHPEAMVVVSDQFRGHRGLGLTLEGAGLSEDSVRWISGRTNFQFGRTTLRVDAPRKLPGEIDNEGSLLMRIERGPASAVLTGDASSIVESRVLGEDWQCQVLKAGHHGSLSSTSVSWLNAVMPRDVVFSCGRDNSYGHPAAAVIQRVEAIGARMWRTDRQGDIAFKVGEGGFEPN